MSDPLHLLLIEDSADDAELIVDRLKDDLFEPEWRRIDRVQELDGALSGADWDIIFLDHSIAGLKPDVVLGELRARELDIPLIIVSGTISDETAVSAMRAGAQDYVLKGNLSRLGAVVRRELGEAIERRSRREAEERVRYLALHDDRTGVPNRTQLISNLAQVIRQQPDHQFTIAVAAFPRLDRVYEVFGFEYGDEAFRESVARIQQAAPEADTVARISESSVGMILTGPDRHTTAHHLVDAFVSPFLVNGRHLGLSCHVGFASYPGHAAEPGALIQLAEAAARRAASDVSRVSAYEPGLREDATRQLVLLSELQGALSRNELSLAFQPKIDLASGEPRSMEALVRWQHPEYGFVPPSQFVPLLEQAGDVRQLTRWVLNAAAQQQHRWLGSGLNVPVAVNLSGQDLTPDMPGLIFELADGWGLPGHALQVEVTESAILADYGAAIDCLTALGDAGIKRALDDFGTGQSSLGQLRGLPMDELKIDRTFVAGVEDDPQARAILETICQLGLRLGLDVVAEGIETAAAARILTEMQCRTGQGYYFCRPMPPDAVLGWFAEQSSTRRAS